MSRKLNGLFEPKYLLVLAKEKFSCAVPELESIGATFGIDLTENLHDTVEGIKIDDSSPLKLLTKVNEDDVKKLLSRSVFAKSALEIWGHGLTLSEVKQSITEYPLYLKEKYYGKSTCFSIRSKRLGKKISITEQVEKIDALEEVLPFEGSVDLKNPDVEFLLVEDYSIRIKGQPPKDPLGIYFGRQVCEGQRNLIGQYSLKNRKFIGNTSMDPMLGIIMANLACARPNSLVCDPFVGTGSLLISAAHFGAYVVGWDISYNILHAQGKSSRCGAGWRQKDETIQHSLSQYGAGHLYVDAMVCDTANHALKVNGTPLFDAIVTDPPYGIREACQRLGSKNGEAPSVPDLAPGQIHFPEQKAYHLDDVFKDLLTFAAKSLVLGGRLVYWLPVHRADYTPDAVPGHPALKLLYNCEQILNSHSSRRLIVMKKHKSPNELNPNEQATINSSIYQGHNAFRDRYFKM